VNDDDDLLKFNLLRVRCVPVKNDTIIAKSLKIYLVPGFPSFAISGVIEVFRMVLPRECTRRNFSYDQHLQLDRFIIILKMT